MEIHRYGFRLVLFVSANSKHLIHTYTIHGDLLHFSLSSCTFFFWTKIDFRHEIGTKRLIVERNRKLQANCHHAMILYGNLVSAFLPRFKKEWSWFFGRWFSISKYKLFGSIVCRSIASFIITNVVQSWDRGDLLITLFFVFIHDSSDIRAHLFRIRTDNIYHTFLHQMFFLLTHSLASFAHR